MPRHSRHLLDLARRGAETRIRELVTEMDLLASEMKLLVNQFPHLRDSFDKDELPLPFILAKGAGRAKRSSNRPARRRRRMSAAAKKAVSLRMKRYWAARRRSKQDG